MDVLNHDGVRLQQIPDRFLGDIDLASLPTEDSHFTVLGASYRKPGEVGIALFRFDHVSGGQFTRWGTVRADIARPTALCMRQWRGEALVAVVAGADGQVQVFIITEGADGTVESRELQRFRLRSGVSGCAVDTGAERLYITETRRGLWRYPLDPESKETPLLIQAADRVRLRAPLEGVALLDDFDRYLFVSSRGDSSVAVWRITRDPVWVGRFIVVPGRVDAVTGTTGLDALGHHFGDLSRGVVVLHDSANDGGQNFKLID